MKNVSRIRASITGRVLGVITEEGETQLIDIAQSAEQRWAVINW